MRWLRTHWVLLTLTIVGAILRFTNLNWDAGGRIHPDEALIVNGAQSVKFFLHLWPGFHDYNGFSVYLLKAISLLTSLILNDPYWSVTYEGISIVGRFISAFLSTLSIPLLYLVGSRTGKKETGIIGATLFTFTPLLIQLAHFYTTESILIFLLLSLLFAASLYTTNPNLPSLVWLSVFAGLLLATKNTAYLFLPIPIIILWVNTGSISQTIRTLALFTAGSIAVFFLASPYSFIDMPGYIDRSRYLTNVVSGRLLMDWTMQFQNTNGFFWIPNLLYAFGPLAILGLVGMTKTILLVKNRRGLPFIFAIWSVCFLLFLAVTYLKFTRYAAPLVPFFALFGAKLLWDLKRTYIGKRLYYGFIGVQILSGLMFFSVYTTPHSSLLATDWIHRNVPPASVILVEEWNSIIRFSGPELVGNKYRIISFNLYSPDDTTKMQRLKEALTQSDYVLLESPKVKNTVTRLRNRYPYSAVFYEQLEAGTLGFTLVAQFTSYPRLGQFAINDETAEETFTVFDHPSVALYKKIR